MVGRPAGVPVGCGCAVSKRIGPVWGDLALSTTRLRMLTRLLRSPFVRTVVRDVTHFTVLSAVLVGLALHAV